MDALDACGHMHIQYGETQMFKRKKSVEEIDTRRPTTRYKANMLKGLTKEQVREYTENGWTNEPADPPSKTVGEIVKGNVFTYFNLVFAVLAVLVIIAGSFTSLTFLGVVIANLVIGIVQEVRAKNTLDRLSVLSAPKAVVIRDGRKVKIPAEKLVLDDIVIFKAGNQICADAVILDGEVTVNESLLTGESDEISKKPGDRLMSGSFVVSGQCCTRLFRVGRDSYISKLTIEAKAAKNEEQSEMMRVLNKLVGVVGIIIIPVGIALVVQQYVIAGETLSESIVSMVAAVIGMIPEGLYLLTSVALAVSVIRLAKKKVLVHDMKCIETLARVDVLCVDKTGTITENDMEVVDVVEMDGYDPDSMPPVKDLINDFAAAMSDDNITMEAIKRHFDAPPLKEAVSVTGFSSSFKYSSATFADGAYVVGAPEFVLREDFYQHKEEIEEYSAGGYRVLVFCKYDGKPDGKVLTEKAVPLALIVMTNPIRKEAAETFRYFEEQGVAIRVISGDNPATVSSVAGKAGITGAEKYVDASTLKTEEQMRDALVNCTVLGRVTPKQKREFVRILKDLGHTVAMTGDGVNDILALKDADCSIAMASGSDAAAQASQLVLLDSDFSCMPSVVLEGRRVVNNIERSATLFLVKNIFSFLMSVFSICFMINYPLEPSQISLISAFTIGIPAFFFALQPNKNMIKGKFLPNVLIKALPAGITDFLIVGALVVFGEVFGVADADISTACTLLLAIVGFMILYNISKPMNALRWTVWIGCMVGLVACSIYLGNIFSLGAMSLECILLFVVFAIMTEPFLRYMTMFFEKIGFHINRRIEKKKLESRLEATDLEADKAGSKKRRRSRKR